jgi:hypothetical protein
LLTREQKEQLIRDHGLAIRASLAEYYRILPLGRPPLKNREPSPHHQLVINALEAVERREISRLVILLPFNSGKTTLAARAFPGWLLTKYPGTRIVLLSHTEGYSEDLSRAIQGDIAANTKLLGIKLNPKLSAASKWALTNGSSFLAMGCQGALTGKRADWLIVDDPIASAEHAFSEAERKKLAQWWSTTVMSRLESDPLGSAPVVVIGTTYHEDDLLGKIQAQNSNPLATKWTVIRIPAISEGEGDLLGRPEGMYLGDGYDDPRGYGKWLRERQHDVTPLEWSAYYQLRPSPDLLSALRIDNFLGIID